MLALYEWSPVLPTLLPLRTQELTSSENCDNLLGEIVSSQTEIILSKMLFKLP
jgi:hypothetical protein